MKAADHLATNADIKALMAEMTEAQVNKVCDCLRVVTHAKLPSSKLAAAEEIAGQLWQAANEAEQADELSDQRYRAVSALYGHAPAGHRYPSVEA